MIHFGFGPKSSILLIFFFNGLVFTFLLFRKYIRDNHQPSKWLGFFILLCCLYICPFMLGYAGWYSIRIYREILFFIPFQQLFLIGPVIFFYTQSLLNKDFSLTRKDVTHFLPAILYMGYTLVVFVTDKLVLDEFYFYADGRDKDLAFWYQMAGLISMLFYLLISLRYYMGYRRIIYQEVSFADTILFTWIQHFLIAFSIILVLRVLFFVLNPEWGEFGSKFWYYLCFSVLFYYIALSGYSNTVRTAIAFDSDLLTGPRLVPEAKEPDMRETQNAEQVIPDLDDRKAEILALIKSQQIYTNPRLTLVDVAEALHTNRNVVSSVINQGFEMNFNDFINAQRIEAVIEKFEAGEHNSISLLGIALECGFNSKTTFNRAFKKQMGLTPREFIAQRGFK